MAGPGGDEVGRVSIRVVPDSSGFRSELQRELAGIERSVKVEIPVVADTGGMRTEVRSVVSSLERDEIDLRTSADLTGANAETRAFVARTEALRPDIDVGADTTKAFTQALATSAAIGALAPTIKVTIEPPEMPELPEVPKVAAGLGSISEAFTSVFEAGAKLPGLFGSIFEGLGSIVGAGTKAFEIGSGLAEKFTGMATSGTKAAGGLASVALAAVTIYSGFVELGAQSAVVLAKLGAVTFVAGAAGAAFSALPAFLFATAAAGATVALGMDGIKKAYESNLKPALDKLKTQVSAVFEKTLKPAMAGIANALPKLSLGFQGVAFTVSTFLNRMAGIFTSVEGVKMLNEVLFNTSVFVAALTPGVASMITEMLKAAQVKEVFKILGEIIGMVAQKVGELFKRFSAGGESSLMVTALGQLKQVLGGVIDVISDLIVKATEFFTYAGPGVTDALGSIRRVIGKIDFKSLGDSFGIFARAVGGFFDSIPQSTWDMLVDAVRELALKFKELAEDPNVQGFFNFLIMLIPVAIRTFSDFLGVIRAVINYFAELKREAEVAIAWIGAKWNELVTIVSIAWAMIKSWISAKTLEIQGAVALGWANIKAAISGKIIEILGDIMIKWAEIKAAISAKITEIRGNIMIKWAEIKNAISAKITEIKTAISTKWAEIKTAISTRIQSILSDVRAKWESIKTAIRDKVNAARDAVRDGWNRIVATVREKVADVVRTARELPGKIRDGLGDLGSLLVAKGKALITGLLQGIKQGVSDALAYASTIAAKIAAVKGPMSYDRRVLTPNGQALIEGFLVGLQGAMAPVLTYAGGIAAQIRSALVVHATTYVHAGQTIGELIAAGVVDELRANLSTGIPAAVAEASRVRQAVSNDPWARVGTVYEDGSVRTEPVMVNVNGGGQDPERLAELVVRKLEFQMATAR